MTMNKPIRILDTYPYDLWKCKQRPVYIIDLSKTLILSEKKMSLIF